MRRSLALSVSVPLVVIRLTHGRSLSLSATRVKDKKGLMALLGSQLSQPPSIGPSVVLSPLSNHLFVSCRRVLAVVVDSRGGQGGLRSARVSPSASSTRTPPPSGRFGGGGLKAGLPRPSRGPGARAAAEAAESSSNKVGCIYFRRRD